MICIPYGHADIITSNILNLCNCVVYKPLRMLICVICRIGVAPESIRRHRRKAPHFDPSPISDVQVESLALEHDIHPTDKFDDLEAVFTAVPGIPYTIGWKCTFPGCLHGRSSKQTMGRHIVLKHRSSITVHPPETSEVQALFDSNETRYPVILPAITPSVIRPPLMHEIAASAYRAVLDAPAELEDRAHLNPFLAKYDWLPIVSDLSPRMVQNWVSLPSGSEPEFEGLAAAIQEYYADIILDLGNFGAYTTILRWIKSSKR